MTALTAASSIGRGGWSFWGKSWAWPAVAASATAAASAARNNPACIIGRSPSGKTCVTASRREPAHLARQKPCGLERDSAPGTARGAGGHFPIGRGGEAGLALEGAGEMALIGEAGQQGDVGQ